MHLAIAWQSPVQTSYTIVLQFSQLQGHSLYPHSRVMSRSAISVLHATHTDTHTNRHDQLTAITLAHALRVNKHILYRIPLSTEDSNWETHTARIAWNKITKIIILITQYRCILLDLSCCGYLLHMQKSKSSILCSATLTTCM